MSSVCSPLLQVVMVMLSCSVFNAQISCRNEAGDPVDWFFFYKLPHHLISEEGSGVEYMYLDSTAQEWQKSRFLINSSRGAVAETLNQVYKGQAYRSNSSVYAFYNDEPPVLDYVEGYGQSKGVLLLDRSQGFWLSHSVPHFPSFPERGYVYPSSGKVYGQTGLCVTYFYDQLLDIAEQLAFAYPRFYNCSVPPAFKSDLPELVLMCAGIKPPMPSDKSAMQLLSSQGTMFLSLVRSDRFVYDFYTLAAQALLCDILVQSSQRPGHGLPSDCSQRFHIKNIKQIQLPGSVRFLSDYDNSKWCVSETLETSLICLGDLDRERDQLGRGGGLICSSISQLFKALRGAVEEYIPC